MPATTSSGIKALFRLQKTIVVLLFISFLCGMVLGISLVTNTDLGSGILPLLRAERQGPPGHGELARSTAVPKHAPLKERPAKDTDKERGSRAVVAGNATDVINDIVVRKQQRKGEGKGKEPRAARRRAPPPRSTSAEDYEVDDTRGGAGGAVAWPEPNYNVHIFYYPWYGNPSHDGGRWLHWNHEYLQHWDKEEARKWPSGRHQPKDDIGSSFYPELGPYSSRDPEVMEDHMKQIRSAGIGVLSVSWYPPNEADGQGAPSDDLLPQLFDVADKYKLKICFHIEPYKDRSPDTLREHLAYIQGRYGNHSAFYRRVHHGRPLPLFYIYDSYLSSAAEWARLLRPEGAATVRRTPLDAIFLGLIVEERHRGELLSAGFDGLYTYFASDGFTYGSSTRHWPTLSSYALTNSMLFVPSIGPGYVDVRVRPWNAHNSKDREQGGYYEQSFRAALAARPPLLSITSFNEWHEGTQIERAVPKRSLSFQYLDYTPQKPDYYLRLTRKWVHKYKRHRLNM